MGGLILRVESWKTFGQKELRARRGRKLRENRRQRRDEFAAGVLYADAHFVEDGG